MRILFLTRWFPYPADNGVRQRIFHLINHLSECAEIDLLTLAQDEVAPDRIEAMRQYCSRVEVFKQESQPAGASLSSLPAFFSTTPRSLRLSYDPAFAQAAARLHAERAHDVVLASELSAAAYALALDAPLRVLDDLQLTLVRDDIARQPSALRTVRARLAWRKHARYGGRTAARFDIAAVASETERQQVARWMPDSRGLVVVPNGFPAELLRHEPVSPVPDSLIYAGALTFSANYDAVQWFLAEIFPLIRQSIPAATLTVTGSTQGVDVAALRLDSGTRLAGWVPDIHALVASQWLSVVPLRMGAGTRLKILESMALGTPVVSTTKGAEGLDLAHGRHLILADTPAAFADAVVRLLRDPAERTRLAEAARAFVSERYTWPAIVTRLHALMDSALAAKIGAMPAKGGKRA